MRTRTVINFDVINDFRLQEVGLRSWTNPNARHESCIWVVTVEAADMQAARQEALQNWIVAPRHHIHQAPAESVGATVQLCTWRTRPCRRLLRGPAVGSADVFRGATSGRGPMGIPSLLPVWLSRALRHSLAADFGTASATEITNWTRWPTIFLRSASLNNSSMREQILKKNWWMKKSIFENERIS